MPRTGAQLLVPIGLAVILLMLGGGALWFRRRQAEL
ncbi:LPXTG cell wall anchor domain-containing protein [Micrococcoides hystricis]|uniref:LPXTG cell wall anchor domain-containing protein n=1 Tax=Micrococcoides hystricis TaxID=1572761 RepID=A0ABV6PC25_9MICC